MKSQSRNNRMGSFPLTITSHCPHSPSLPIHWLFLRVNCHDSCEKNKQQHLPINSIFSPSLPHLANDNLWLRRCSPNNRLRPPERRSFPDAPDCCEERFWDWFVLEWETFKRTKRSRLFLDESFRIKFCSCFISYIFCCSFNPLRLSWWKPLVTEIVKNRVFSHRP